MSQYDENFNKALQWLWGDGFLSPGGSAEVAQMLSDVSVDGARVLDVGCGLGAAAVLLAAEYGAAEVVGIDVEAHLIEESQQRAERAGLADRLSFQLVEPGPIPLDSDRFDVVFTKDAIVHIPDKPAFYAEVTRLLCPGGTFVGSDWLRGGPETATPRAKEWLEFVHLNFQMQTLDELAEALATSGFSEIRLDDRNHWYQSEIESELAAVSGDRLAELAELIGEEAADYRAESSRRKKEAIDDGFLRPTHFVGVTAR